MTENEMTPMERWEVLDRERQKQVNHLLFWAYVIVMLLVLKTLHDIWGLSQ